MSHIESRITTLFAEIVGDDPVLGLDTLPRDVGGWDSLAQIRLVSAIEEEFDCVLPSELLVVGQPLTALAAAVGVAIGVDAR